jgi:SAM-dependent methyltransferase
MASETEHPAREVRYACPVCKRVLAHSAGALRCEACDHAYPVVDGIPDFISQDLTQSRSPVLRGVAKVDRLATIYETGLWYPLVMTVYGGFGSPSIAGVTKRIAALLEGVQGAFLDAACGPGTYGRRLSTPARTFYGVDISMGMLRRGARYVTRTPGISMHFARSTVEQLPFEAARFDGAVCCGALHLFESNVVALREIARTLKPGAPLAVFTFYAGDRGVLRHPGIREHIASDHGIHVPALDALADATREAGFTRFDPWTHGSVVIFSARRPMSTPNTADAGGQFGGKGAPM